MSFLTDSILVLSKQKIEITIHINISLPSGEEECYFEMGILAKNENEVETSIEILLPIKSDEFQFEDLSNRFIENPTYLRLILKLGENKSKDYYFRFRLKNIKKERLCLEKETTSFVIDPFKRFINVAGFHINNIRNVKNGRLDLGENQISIQEINTFFICDITATWIDSSIPKRSFRLLEENTWEYYMSDNVNKINDSQKKIIYQFKKMANEGAKNNNVSKTEKTTNENAKSDDEQSVIYQIKDFKLFVKTSHIDESMPIYFLAIIILIAILANALYGMLTPTFSDLEIILTIVLFVVLYKHEFISFLLTKIKNLKS